MVGIHKQAPICHPEDIASFLVTMFVNALRKAISTFSISLKETLIETIWVKCVLKGAVCLVSMNLLGHLQHGIQIGAKPVIVDVSDIMLRPLGVPNVPTSVFQQGGNLNGACIDLVRLNAHRI